MLIFEILLISSKEYRKVIKIFQYISIFLSIIEKIELSSTTFPRYPCCIYNELNNPFSLLIFVKRFLASSER